MDSTEASCEVSWLSHLAQGGPPGPHSVQSRQKDLSLIQTKRHSLVGHASSPPHNYFLFNVEA